MINQIYPKVTIAIPTFNRAKYLNLSITSCLKQSYPNIDIVISNNFSTDNTKELLDTFKEHKNITIFNQSANIGMLNNFNFCLKVASGEFFLLLSDDDILEVDAIKNLIYGFKFENVSLSYGRVKFRTININSNNYSYDASQIENGEKVINLILNYKRVAYPSATLYRTKNIKSFGGYPEVGTSCDFALFALIANNGHVFFVKKHVVEIFIHFNNLSFSIDAYTSQITLLKWFIKNNKFNTIIIENLKKYIKRNIFYSGLSHYNINQNEKYYKILSDDLLKTNSLFHNIIYTKLFFNILYKLKSIKNQ